MFNLKIAAICLAIVGCTQATDPKVQAVLDAGNAALSAANKCIAHMKTGAQPDIPECNASSQLAAYNDAKLKVTTPGVPALQAMDEKINMARMEGMALVMRPTAPSK